MIVTQELVRALFDYDADEGRLFWNPRPREMFGSNRGFNIWNKRFAGKPAFTCLSKGYPNGRIGRKFYSAHRIAWLYVYGDLPEQIDHINGDRADYRIANLRAANAIVNARNLRRSKFNTSGATGVVWSKRDRKWVAQIKAGKPIYLGSYDRFEDAVAARAAANQAYGFHENHGLFIPTPAPKAKQESFEI